jgi:hypothetical protein
LLQEKKVLLISKNIGDMAIYISTILALMKPFSWPSGILSVLSADLIDYLDAPFPFIAGIESNVWEQIQKRRKGQLDSEITVVHLQNDSKYIMSNEWTADQASKLKSSKSCQYAFAKPFVEKLDKSKKKLIDLKSRSEECWIRFVLETKSIFLQLMVLILSNLDWCVNKE